VQYLTQIHFCLPSAFGEVSVKNRIKTVLNYKKPAFYVIIAALILCITVSACFLTDPLTDYSEQYKDMALGVMIVDHEGTIATTDPWYNYFDIKKFDDVTMPATYSIDISIRKISKDYITISFNEKLLLDDTAVSKIKLKPGESVTLSTMTTGGGTTYTFFITEWSKVSEGGIYHPQTGDVLQKLTLDDVIELSKKGATLSWEDFEPYYYYETGMGLYIRAYPINDMFQVSIGSTIGINYAPLYIYITANDGLNTFHDIRYSGVEEYINKHKQNPIVKSCSYGFTCSPVGSSDIVGKMLEQVVNISNMIKSSTGALPLVKIENRAELEEFLAETESLIDQNKTYPDVLPFSETIYNYDNEFFESETLFLLYITAPSTAHRYNINYINKSEGVLKFGISAIEPQTGDTAMEGWIMAIGIPTYQISDVSTFEARLVSPLS